MPVYLDHVTKMSDEETEGSGLRESSAPNSSDLDMPGPSVSISTGSPMKTHSVLERRRAPGKVREGKRAS